MTLSAGKEFCFVCTRAGQFVWTEVGRQTDKHTDSPGKSRYSAALKECLSGKKDLNRAVWSNQTFIIFHPLLYSRSKIHNSYDYHLDTHTHAFIDTFM